MTQKSSTSSSEAKAPRSDDNRSREADKNSQPTSTLPRAAAVDDVASPEVRGWHHLLRQWHIWPLPPRLAWIVPPLTSWAKFKPVLRSALIAWIMMFFMVIAPVERELGNASFLVIVFSLLQPAELPLTGIMEREFFMLFFGCCSWIWCCIAIAISHAVRHNKLPPSEANLEAIFAGRYIDKGPAIVCAVFLAFGSALWLYLKIRFGPSPFIYSSIIACLALDIMLTDAPLFPYPYYLLGRSILLPMAVKTAVTLIVSLICFPKSVNSLFVDRIVLILQPLSQAIRGQLEQFKSSPLDTDFAFTQTRNIVGQAERAVPLVAAATRLLSREVSFGLASGEDLRTVEFLVKALVAPANGWSQYFGVIENDLRSGHFPVPKSELPQTRPPSPSSTPVTRTPLHSRPPTRPQTPTQSHVDLHERHLDDTNEQQDSDNEAHRHHDRFGSRLNVLLNKAPLYSHLHNRQSRPPSVDGQIPASPSYQTRHGFFNSGHHTPDHHHHPVGTWEYLRYAQIEEKLHQKSADIITDRIFSALGESSVNIMTANAEGIDYVVTWLETLNAQRYRLFLARFTGQKVSISRCADEVAAKSMAETMDKLRAALEHFKNEERLRVVDMFRQSIEDPRNGKGYPHRYLFQAFVHQHTNIVFTQRLLKLLEELDRIETMRGQGQLWLPRLPRLLQAKTWMSSGDDNEVVNETEGDAADDMHHHPEEDWYKLRGLGGASPRDPDSLEPSTSVQRLGTALHTYLGRLWHGNLLFAVKAGTLTALLSVPFFLSASAGFTQREKGLWTLFVAQLSFGRHRGDSVLALVSRTLCTLAGAVVAMLIWYISSGSGRASPFSFMVVWGFAVVPIFIFRIYWPFSPQTAIITALTIAVCVGYSYKDSYNPAPYTSPGHGWELAWRRIVEVIMGATAAVIWSFVPPTSTLREYLRQSHASTIHRLGILHCKLIAFTLNHDEGGDVDPAVLSAEIISLRAKLRRLDARKAQVAYETSLRGAWPRERYEMLFETQLALSKLLSAAVIISQQLGPGYSRALLRRTRFAQQGFMADVLTAYTLCSTALRTAQPLPQLSPVLFSRYLSEAGFLFRAPNAERDRSFDREDEEELGLPQELTMKVLQSEEYCAFAVGVVTLSHIVMTLDKLVLATKQLVGESFELPPELYYETQRKIERERELRKAQEEKQEQQIPEIEKVRRRTAVGTDVA